MYADNRLCRYLFCVGAAAFFSAKSIRSINVFINVSPLTRNNLALPAVLEVGKAVAGSAQEVRPNP